MSGPNIVTFRLSDEAFAELVEVAGEIKTAVGMRKPSHNDAARHLVLESLKKRKSEKKEGK